MEAARTLRTRIEQQVAAFHRMTPANSANLHASLPAELTCDFLRGVEDLVDRVTLLESNLQRLFSRLEFLGHVSRLLGHEDWSDFSIDDRTPSEARGDRPGALVTAVQASMPGTSGPASSQSPGELAGTRPTQ